MHEGRILREGEMFSKPCQECYCSFGVIECATTHCKETHNTLGMELIERAVQVLISTNTEQFPGTVTVMNSVLKHSKHKVKFSIVLYQSDDDPLHATHLKNWLDGTQLRFADYVIVPFNDKTKEWVGADPIYVREYWEEYQVRKQHYDEELHGKKEQYDEELHGKKDPMSVDTLKESTRTAALMLNTLLPREHRVVFLSNNVIVRGDIAELFNLDIKGKPIAVFNSCQATFSNLFKLERVNVSGNRCVFSPGVMVVDLDIWFSTEVESTLSRLFWEVLRGDELKEKNEDVLSFAPLLLEFWNSTLDLRSQWGVCYPGKSECNHGDQESHVLDWNFQKPWESGKEFKIWNQYYLKDPTGLFRLTSPRHDLADL